MNSASFDLIVIGAGPAGMSAAIEARALGLSVAVIDEQPAAGGQIYRAIERVHAEGRAQSLGSDYLHGLELARRFAACGATHLAAHQVWQVEPPGRVFASNGSCSRMLNARRILIATGAMERPVPIRGWTLPGVMTVGAAQILHKTLGVLPEQGVWIAGSGPLALYCALQLAHNGARIEGFLDTSRTRNRRAALKHWRGALRGWRYLVKGVGFIAALRRAGVRRITGVQEVEAHGTKQVERVRWQANGRWHEAPAKGLLLHEGVVPQSHLTMAIGCAHDWSAVLHCFVPRLDAFGNTDVNGVMVAGDSGGIGGALVAALQGQIAAVSAAAALGFVSAAERDKRARVLRTQLAPHVAVRPFLDTLFAPRPALLAPPDDVLVCRCESISAARVREQVQLGCTEPNQVKSRTRCGMGPCQGRMCGLTLTGTIAAARGVAPDAVGALRIRPPLKPLRLSELAALSQQQAQQQAPQQATP